MKIVSALFLFICIFQTTVFSQRGKKQQQNKINVLDNYGRKQGYWKIMIPDGLGTTRNSWEGIFLNNRPTGVWIKKNYDGKVYWERIYYDTSENKALQNEYYLSGRLKSTGYLNSIPANDTSVIFDSRKEKDVPYIITHKLAESGKWIYYHPNGKIESEGFYDKGVKAGKWSYYNDNGDLIETKTY